MVSLDQVRISIPGAEVVKQAAGSTCFSVEFPFRHLRFTEKDNVRARDLVTFQFESGAITFREVRFTDSRILLGTDDARGRHSGGAASQSGPVSKSRIKPLVGSLEGAPLGLIYCRLREIEPTPPSTEYLLYAKLKAEKILQRAERLLSPMEISRTDLEEILSKRFGAKG